MLKALGYLLKEERVYISKLVKGIKWDKDKTPP